MSATAGGVKEDFARASPPLLSRQRRIALGVLSRPVDVDPGLCRLAPDLHRRIEPGGVLQVPALMNARSGMASRWDTIGEPHFPQNCRRTGSPLSPTSSKVLSVWPAILRLSFGTATITENDVPLCFWQCGQWQTAVSSGSALQVYLMLPHQTTTIHLAHDARSSCSRSALARTPTSNSDGMIASKCVRFRPCTLGRYCRVVCKLDLKRRRGRAPASAFAAAPTAS